MSKRYESSVIFEFCQLNIIRSTARTFEREQWEALEKRLLAWKCGLNNVLEVVANARRQGGVHAPTQTAAAPA